MSLEVRNFQRTFNDRRVYKFAELWFCVSSGFPVKHARGLALSTRFTQKCSTTCHDTLFQNQCIKYSANFESCGKNRQTTKKSFLFVTKMSQTSDKLDIDTRCLRLLLLQHIRVSQQFPGFSAPISENALVLQIFQCFLECIFEFLTRDIIY